MPHSQAMRHFVCGPSAASRAAGSAIVIEHRLVITVQFITLEGPAKSIPKNSNVFSCKGEIKDVSRQFCRSTT